MRNDVLTIIKTLMEIGNQLDPENDTVCEGLSVIKDKWPNLTTDEKREIAVVIEAYQVVAFEAEEEEDTYNTQTKRTLDLEEEPRGIFGRLHKRH